MNKVIRFSQKKFSRNVLSIVISSLILYFILAYLLQEFKELAYFLSALVCFISILVLFYKIRYYPHTLVILDDSINIEYLNKSFFRQKPFSGNIVDIDIEKEKNRIILSKQNQTIAVISRGSVSKEDGEFLFSVLKK